MSNGRREKLIEPNKRSLVVRSTSGHDETEALKML